MCEVVFFVCVCVNVFCRQIQLDSCSTLQQWRSASKCKDSIFMIARARIAQQHLWLTATAAATTKIVVGLKYLLMLFLLLIELYVCVCVCPIEMPTTESKTAQCSELPHCDCRIIYICAKRALTQ